MELVFGKADMTAAMKIVSGAIGKSPIPILTNVIISASYDPLPGLLKATHKTDNGIYLAATDLEIGIRASVPGQVVEGGAITLPAREFAGMIKAASHEDVRLSTGTDSGARIECGSAQFRIKGLPADEFPSLIPGSDSGTQLELMNNAEDKTQSSFVSIDSETLLSMIQMTYFAVSKDERRHFLNGIHLSMVNSDDENASGHLVTMAATDGTRLAVASCMLKDEVAMDKGAIIPIKAAAQLRNMLSKSDRVRISIHDSRVAFEIDTAILVSRMIDGEYPDYRKVIPEGNSIKLTMDTKRLLAISRRVVTMANPKLPSVKMEAIGDVLKLSSATPEYGEAYEEIQIKKEGKDIDLALNIQYMMDALRAIQAEEIIMEIEAPLKPVLIKPGSGNGYLYVLMPMKL